MPHTELHHEISVGTALRHEGGCSAIPTLRRASSGPKKERKAICYSHLYV